jgi:hypothetical protein
MKSCATEHYHRKESNLDKNAYLKTLIWFVSHLKQKPQPLEAQITVVIGRIT